MDSSPSKPHPYIVPPAPPPPPVSNGQVSHAPDSGDPLFAGHRQISTPQHVSSKLPSVPLTHNKPSTTGLDERQITPAESASLPSVANEKLESLRAQKAKTLEKLEQTMETQGQATLLSRALDVLNDVKGARDKEQEALLITVAPPPDFKSVTVFPPEEGITAERLKELQEMAIDVLQGYHKIHKESDWNHDTLKSTIESCKDELKKIHHEFEELHVQEPDWQESFKMMESKAHSFELRDTEGKIVLHAMASTPKTEPVVETHKPSSAQHASGQKLGQKLGNGSPKVGDLTAKVEALALPTLKPTEGVSFPAVHLLGEGESKNGFSDIYLQNGQQGRGNLVSLNAGDANLYLGGGTINSVFGDLLVGSSDSSKNGFADYHQKIEALAPDQRGFIVPDVSTGAGIDGVKYSLCMPGTNGLGSAFIHVFDDNHTPHGHPQNRAMLYMVPPNGQSANYRSKKQFLADVRQSAANTFALVQEYNLRAKSQGLEPLEVLRTCRFSSGHYARAGTSGAEVARAIHEGYQQAAAQIVQGGGRVLLKGIEYEDGSAQNRFFSKAKIQASAAQP